MSLAGPDGRGPRQRLGRAALVLLLRVDVKRALLAALVVLAACARPVGPGAPAPAPTMAADDDGVDAAPLLELTKFVENGRRRVFSILVSKNGKIVYELYTSGLTREHAHYVMSVTKSVTSALVGIAIGEKLVAGADVSIADALPTELFPTPTDRDRFKPVTLKHVLGMSALDAQVPPHRTLPEDLERQKGFLAAPNRVKFALAQPLLPEPGVSFQYTDITPQIAIGIVSYATRTTALEYAERRLFGPLGFQNYEWMHEDAVGIDNGAYGLRLRPVDMQKFGMLYLQGGQWNGKQVIPKEWVEESFRSWVVPKQWTRKPVYGWYWWEADFGERWRGHMAVGWRGQRIAVIPDQKVVVTMTGNVTDDENSFFDQIMHGFVVPAISGGRRHPELRDELAAAVERVRLGPSRFAGVLDARMIPSIEPKEQHHAFRP